jgi:hypothetical protein
LRIQDKVSSTKEAICSIVVRIVLSIGIASPPVIFLFFFFFFFFFFFLLLLSQRPQQSMLCEVEAGGKRDCCLTPNEPQKCEATYNWIGNLS